MKPASDARQDTGQAAPPRALAVLPARLGSTRLPRKVLLDATGLPLVVHTARRVESAASVVRVVVATDSPEVEAVVREHGLEVLLTSPDHPSGTDRVREAARAIGADPARSRTGGAFDVVLNVQADEPEIEPGDLDRLLAAFGDTAVTAATLAAPLDDPVERSLPSVVKVVCDASGDALYFSRAPIPSTDHARPGTDQGTASWRHVGVYAFRPAALERFCSLPVGRLEALESLEQLRWLEAGEAMRVVSISRAPRGVDTAADYEDFVARERGAPHHRTHSR